VPGRSSADRSSRLGQHFLGNAQIAARLVADAGIDSDDRVVDLGAGTGVLTSALAARAGAVFAVEIDDALARRLARRFARASNVTVVRGDVREVPLPLNPYRVVANPPFARTASILRRLLDDPAGGLVRADVVVQWQVARHRAAASDGLPGDLLGATWGPWWQFRRGRRLPAACFRPRPSVDAGVLVITRRSPPLLPPEAFDGYAAWVSGQFGRRPDATQIALRSWVDTFRTRG
jgi:23S rRNA (adenine-N6)-dimethyltransferase